jgi:serine/threonine protein kinase
MTQVGNDHGPRTTSQRRVDAVVAAPVRSSSAPSRCPPPMITWSDVSLGPVLGRGGFSQIHVATFERRKLKLMFPHMKIVVKSPRVVVNKQKRKTMKVRGVVQQQRQEGAPSSSSHHSKSATKKAQKALEDLHTEARLLSKLHHPNVVRLLAVGSDSSSSSSNRSNYFLVLERLDKTLMDMIREWKEERQQRQIDCMTQEEESMVVTTTNHGPGRRLGAGLLAARLFSRRHNKTSSSSSHHNHHRHRRPPLLTRILDVAVMIAQGLEYVHSQRMVHRDVKPGNVGFDSNGVVKLLDFGLAREIMDENSPSSSTSLSASHLKHAYGTPRYMAPEVGLGKACGTYSDVYSFSVVLYEMITLSRPYSQYTTVSDFRKYVYKQRERPDLNLCPDVPLVRDCLLPSGWHADYNKRLTISEMRQSLQRKLWSHDTPAKLNGGSSDVNVVVDNHTNNNTTTVLMLNDGYYDEGEEESDDGVTMV